MGPDHYYSYCSSFLFFGVGTQLRDFVGRLRMSRRRILAALRENTEGAAPNTLPKPP